MIHRITSAKPVVYRLDFAETRTVVFNIEVLALFTIHENGDMSATSVLLQVQIEEAGRWGSVGEMTKIEGYATSPSPALSLHGGYRSSTSRSVCDARLGPVSGEVDRHY